MSVFELTLLTVINMMGSGIVMLPTTLAEVGTISILFVVGDGCWLALFGIRFCQMRYV